VNRGPAKKKVFGHTKLKTHFLSLLEWSSKKYKLEIHAFCILENQYQILIRTRCPNLSMAMAVLNSKHCKYYNAVNQHEGPIFKERFKSILIEDESYLINVTRYIHLYPKFVGFTKNPEDYEWSSCKDYLSTVKLDSWIKTELINTLFSGNYSHFLKKGNTSQMISLFSAKRLPRKI